LVTETRFMVKHGVQDSDWLYRTLIGYVNDVISQEIGNFHSIFFSRN
jgi:hypothetical protein